MYENTAEKMMKGIANGYAKKRAGKDVAHKVKAKVEACPAV